MSIVLAAAKELFARCPSLQGIRWYQYTPHFNDGDECIFSMHGMYFLVGTEAERNARNIENLKTRIKSYSSKNDSYYRSEVEKMKRELEERQNGTFSADEDSDYLETYDADLDEVTKKLCDSFDRQLNHLDDGLKIIFGDHCQVSLLRDDEEFAIDDHEHD